MRCFRFTPLVFLLALPVLLLSACSNDDDSPSGQINSASAFISFHIDNQSFNYTNPFIEGRAITNDSTLWVQWLMGWDGTNGNNQVKVSWSGPRDTATYVGSWSIEVYVMQNGIEYSSINANCTIKVTQNNSLMTGTFNGTLIKAPGGGDTLVVTNGVFHNVPVR